jgi:hypothetical protein
MRALVTTALLFSAATLAFACGDEPRRSSDDDDGFITETTLGNTASSSAQSGSGGAVSSGPVGAGGAGATGAGGAAVGGAGGAQVAVGDLVISEIMNNPAAVLDADGEWFEVHNVTSQVIDLAGMSIRHTANSTAAHTIGATLLVAPGGFAVLACNGNVADNGGVVADYVYDGSVSLNNSVDYLAIVLADGTVIDETSWNEASGLDPDGASRSLDAAAMLATANDDDTNFCEASSTMPSGDAGTPGASNDSCP